MIFKKIIRSTKAKRIFFFVLSDFLLFNFSIYLSASFMSHEFLIYWILIPILKITLLYLFGIYKVPWRYFGFRDFIKSFTVFLGLMPIVAVFTSNLKVAILDFLFSFTLFLILRGGKRFYLEILKKKKFRKATLIIGAGNTGEYLVRELLRGNYEYKPIAFVDDDPNKLKTKIHGVEVKGSLKDVNQLIRTLEIEAAIIAIPSLNHKRIRSIFEDLRRSGVKEIKIPKVKDLPETPKITKFLEDLSIEDLLYREEVKINYEEIKKFLKGKKILVTGAAGSIGSEIVKQLLFFEPSEIIALEIDETELHNLTLKIDEIVKNNNVKNVKFRPIVADIRDFPKLENLFMQYKPDIVFHAAAYKHVPLMELFPDEAVKTNIFGTFYVAKAACKAEVKKFINISTDKAVNPVSVMGATKRYAEIICRALNEICNTKYISVRFGNVLASRGSVIPIFLEQIKKGGPLTITHPEMKRYFMTIKEAVLLVLQAAAIGKGGEIFVLDMGEPVKIVKLAEDLIKLHGLEPYKDIDIVITGMRPGEKLFEELLTAEEGTYKTQYEKIFIAKSPPNRKENISIKNIEEILEQLKAIIYKTSPDEIKKFLAEIVPYYKPHRK